MSRIRADAPGDCSTLPPNTDVVVPGFAIVAICCLLIETLARFRDLSIPPRQNNELIEWFLTSSAFSTDFDKQARLSFAERVRNGVLHEAEPRKWIIKREVPKGKICEAMGDRYVLNRRQLTRALKTEFQMYVNNLTSGLHVALRAKFIAQMDKIARRA